MRLFNDFDVYDYHYTYEEMKVMCVIGMIEEANDLDYEDCVRIASAVYWHWVDGRDASEDAPNVLKMLIETIDVMDNHRTARRKEDFKDIIDFWLEPDLGTMSQYDLRQIRFAYEKGYELGKNRANDIRKALKRPHRSTKRKLASLKVND